MLLWLTMIAVAFLITFGIVFNKYGMKFAGGALCGVIAVMTIVVVSNRITEPGLIAKNEKRYEALVYKAETESIRDEFGVVNKEYIDEIQAWNEDLADGKAMQDNFWIGIFYPHIFDEFEYIDLESIEVLEEANVE